MLKKLLFLWWDYCPPTMIRVMYRSTDFRNNEVFMKIFIQNQYAACSKLEKEFLHSRFDKLSLFGESFKEIVHG